jgi:alkaline phosphatase D
VTSPLTKIAVTSCSKLQRVNPQPVWARITAERPDGVILLGDNVYLDDDGHTDATALGMELRRLYENRFAEPNFGALVADLHARQAPVLAIYDDHDFIGDNRYGGDFPSALREAARAELHRAFGPYAPEGSAIPGEAYRAHRFPLVDALLLDVRFHRRSPSASRDDADAVLGPEQWAWLEESVAESRVPYLLVASSTTFHAFADESWEEYPRAFARLRGLLRGRAGAFIVSGDVHRNAVYDDSEVVEIVSSGVAGRGAIFGAMRENYALLHFDADAMRVELRSRKIYGRFDFHLPLANWVLP